MFILTAANMITSVISLNFKSRPVSFKIAVVNQKFNFTRDYY